MREGLTVHAGQRIRDPDARGDGLASGGVKSQARGAEAYRRRSTPATACPIPPWILVVEEDAPTRTSLADGLTADGYELLAAGRVRDALRQLEYHHVDLAVVDVRRPDGPGWSRRRGARRDGARARGSTRGCASSCSRRARRTLIASAD